METRYWIKKYDKHNHAPEEIADLMFLAKGQRSMIANREIPIVEEKITDGGHIFKYKPIQGIILNADNRHGDYIREIPIELTDAQRSKTVEALFNMHDKEVLRVRKKLPSTSKSSRKSIKKKRSKK